jgi:uncharacterized protein
MKPVVHFEMPYEDQGRAIGFYEKAFGWKSILMGSKYGDYVMVQTSETNEVGMPLKPGFINGGLYKKTPEAAGPSVVISVEDIRKAMEEVKEAGGTILGGMKPGEPDDIPGVGLFSSFLDTEGNRVGMIQPMM